MKRGTLALIACMAAILLLMPAFTPMCGYDADWDGVAEKEDNCQAFYNPGQTDADEDLIGDACDADTPQGGLVVAGCYDTVWPPLTGIGWEAFMEILGPTEDGVIGVFIYWVNGEWTEAGFGTTDETRVWYEVDNKHNPFLYTWTLGEGLAEDLDGDDIADVISGVWTMLECDSLDGNCDVDEDILTEEFRNGEWTAERIDDLYCEMVSP